MLLCLLAAGCDGIPLVAERAQASTQQCPAQTVEGIDVFQGTGAIDWTLVKGSGRQFAFIKTTQGDYNLQSTFAQSWSQSRAAGVLRSPYHFFDPTIDGVAQARWFLAALDSAGGLQDDDLPPMLDIECPVSGDQTRATSAGPSCEHAGDSGWAPGPVLAQRIFDWLDAVEAAVGRKAILYSYSSWFGNVGFADPKLAAYPLFVATYGACASVPAPWLHATFWQYSDKAAVPGLQGQADLDRFLGDPSELARFIAASAASDGGADLLNQNGDQGSGAGAHGGCQLGRGALPTAWPLAVAYLLALGPYLLVRRPRVRRRRIRSGA
jgi:lysozyme